MSCVPRSQQFGPVSPGRPGRDTQNTDPAASENRFDGSSPRFINTPLSEPIQYGDVPLDRVWFLTSLS